MPLFGTAGRQAAPAPRGPVVDPVPAQAERLGQRLREIAAGTVAPEEAFEPALRALLDSTNCAAGALCLYDQLHEMLRLAAEVGLSDEGCRHLRSVGGGATWDMPLHSLLNRRAYLIDSAAQNRYVPSLVEGAAQTIACIPLHSGTSPLGSLILITLRPHVLGERDIRMVDRPLRELVKMIEMIRRRGPGAPVDTPSVVPAPPPPPAAAALPAPAPAPDAGLRDRLVEAETALAEEQARATQEQVRATEDVRAAVDANVGALHAALAETETETRRLRDRLAEIEGALERACTERDELRRSLDAAGVERKAVVAALETARADHDALLATLDASRTACAALQAKVEATRAERDAALSFGARSRSPAIAS